MKVSLCLQRLLPKLILNVFQFLFNMITTSRSSRKSGQRVALISWCDSSSKAICVDKVPLWTHKVLTLWPQNPRISRIMINSFNLISEFFSFLQNSQDCFAISYHFALVIVNRFDTTDLNDFLVRMTLRVLHQGWPDRTNLYRLYGHLSCYTLIVGRDIVTTYFECIPYLLPKFLNVPCRHTVVSHASMNPKTSGFFKIDSTRSEISVKCFSVSSPVRWKSYEIYGTKGFWVSYWRLQYWVPPNFTSYPVETSINNFHLRLVRFDSASRGEIICTLLISNFISCVWFNFDRRLIFDSVIGIPYKISSNPL